METIVQNLFFDLKDLKMTESHSGTCFSLKGCNIEGVPGAPAFPVMNVCIALPPQTKPANLSTKIVKKTLVSKEPIFVACIQPPKTPYDLTEGSRNRPALPDEELYKKSADSLVAIMGETTSVYDNPVVSIAISPMRYTADGTIEFVENIIIEITLKEDTNQFVQPMITPLQRFRDYSFVSNSVLNPELVKITPFDKLPTVKVKTMLLRGAIDYLIITDNNKWNERDMVITGSAGDMVSEFNRFAEHKKKKGYRTCVIQVKDIVNGKYGNFVEGSRDLQEVIRNFLKATVRAYGVDWLLLGGDVSIIPTRRACCSDWGQIWVRESSQLEENTSKWNDAFLGIRVSLRQLSKPNLSINDENGRYPFILTNYETGRRIPYGAPGDFYTNVLGWHFATDETFSTRSVVPTTWVRVNGPQSIINNKMVFYTYESMIPTDLYYSSLYGPHYNQPGLHDWDLLDNGLYGQHNDTNYSLGGIDLWPNVTIGRAPVESKEEAKIFVDKVIEYDNWGVTHPAVDYNRFKKMLYVADTWHEFNLQIYPSIISPPGNNCFYYNAEAGYSLINCPAMIEPKNFEKHYNLCYVDSSGVKKVIKYFNPLNNTGSLGWFFAKSETDLSPTNSSINNWIFEWLKLPHNPLHEATQWIVVIGPNEIISPSYFQIGEVGIDNSINEQEELLDWMHNNFPRINQVQRLYSDVADMSPGGVWAEAGLKNLTRDNIKQELNKGPHFVCLIGHGSANGVAELNINMANDLNNGNETFIAFADSCSTNAFDHDIMDCLGEQLILNPHGGAIAYIGNTRFGWSWLGYLSKLKFFKSMKYFRHIGLLNDSRFSLIDSDWALRRIWTILTQTLLGDPEMNVYRDDRDAIPHYIGNKKTKQLHQSTCCWVEKYMADSNKKHFDFIEEGLFAGYDGCYFCLKEYDRRVK